LRSTAGVESARVDLMAHRARVVFNPAVARPEAMIAAIREAGYDAVLPRAGVELSAHDETIPKAMRTALITLFAGAVAMLMAMPLGSDMGRLDHALMDAVPWLYSAP
jgi:Cu+-exporting ATPase